MKKTTNKVPVPVKETKTKENPSDKLQEVFDLIKLMSDTGLSELEVETSAMKLILKKFSSQVVSFHQPIEQIPQGIPMIPRSSLPLKSSEKKEVSEKTAVEDTYHKILSPMSGTFYRAPSPSSPPYVKDGDAIIAGQPVCIVEAMKLMNEIKADKPGKIVKVLLENGKPVEKGTVLFHIDLKS